VFSSRTPDDLEPNQLARLLEEQHAAGSELVDLTASNPTTAALPGAAAWQERIAQALAEGARAVYAPDPRGLASAREAVCQYYRRRGRGRGHAGAPGLDLALDPHHVVLTASTSESYGFLFKLLCDPGDEVLIPAPSYPLFAHLAELDAVRVRSYEDGTVPEIGPRVRAIIIVSPGNPTGAMLDADRLGALAQAAAAAGVALIGDEVFADYIHEPEAAARYTSVLAARQALVFGLGGLSKAAGMPHLKLGWIAVSGPAALREQALARLDLIADTYLSVSTPVQAALPALFDIGAEIRAAIAGRVRDNLRVLLAARLDVIPPPAGWYALVRLAPGHDEEDAAAALLTEDRVQVFPGYFFDIPSEQDVQHLVVSLLPPPEVFAEGVRRMQARLAPRSPGRR
jgi:alanine-synthesizing transaminase